MTYTFKIAALATLIAVGGMSFAEARDRGPREPVSFETLDTNADGQITQEELRALRAARWTNVDANGDGQISRDELLANVREGAERRVDRMIDRLDADENGTLSQAELENARGKRGGDRLFNRADSDGDGALSKTEYDTAMAEMQQRREKRQN